MSTRTTSAQAGSAQTTSAQTGSVRTGNGWAGSARTTSARPDSAQTTSAQATSDQATSDRKGNGRAAEERAQHGSLGSHSPLGGHSGEQSRGGHLETGHRDGHREHGSRKPPVTQQEDWETMLRPWILQVEDALEIDDLCDVDRVHEMTGVVASGVQRSMAPISSFLVGIAVGRGASLEDACRVVERVTVERAGAEPGAR